MPFITIKLTNVEEILVNSRNSFLTVITDCCCCKPETVRNTKGANCERFKPLWVRLAVPSALAVTMLCSQVTGMPGCILSITPKATSHSSCSATCSLQCTGTLTGLLVATGSASGFTRMDMGGPVIAGRGWCGHVLKVDAAYWDRIHWHVFSVFSAVSLNGNSHGMSGGGLRYGHPQAASWCPTSFKAAADPTSGKESDMILNCSIAARLRYRVSTAGGTYPITGASCRFPPCHGLIV